MHRTFSLLTITYYFPKIGKFQCRVNSEEVISKNRQALSYLPQEIGAAGAASQKVVATASRRKRVYKRTGEPSVPFAKEEEQGSGRMFFCKEKRSKANFAPTWWRRMDSNHRSRRQQIYSLPPLAARELLLELVMGLEPTTC